MPLKSIVKVSHLSNLSDARYCAGMGVELLGFRVLERDEHYMPPGVFQDIRGWISGPKIIAELYGISGAEEITSVKKAYAPDYFELTFEDFKKFRDHLGLPCIVHFANATEAKTVSPNDDIVYVLVDEPTSCSDIQSIDRPVLINIGSLEKLEEKTGQRCFDGYVLQGPQELRPGITNYDQLGEILEALEED
jgi:phosphoribosylanthranilate isomerase